MDSKNLLVKPLSTFILQHLKIDDISSIVVEFFMDYTEELLFYLDRGIWRLVKHKHNNCYYHTLSYTLFTDLTDCIRFIYKRQLSKKVILSLITSGLKAIRFERYHYYNKNIFRRTASDIYVIGDIELILPYSWKTFVRRKIKNVKRYYQYVRNIDITYDKKEPNLGCCKDCPCWRNGYSRGCEPCDDYCDSFDPPCERYKDFVYEELPLQKCDYSIR